MKIILRHFLRNKFYSFTNLAGLVTCFLILTIVTLFTAHETSFESVHEKRDRIGRITMHSHAGQYDMHWARINADYINNLVTEFEEVEALVRFQDYDPRDVKALGSAFRISHAYTVDANIFSIFNYELVEGNPETALVNPNSVVLTESTARLLFGDTSPVGQSLEFTDNSDQQIYEVTGIMKDLPSTTHMPVNLLTSYSSAADRTGWAYTYILVNEPGDLARVEARIPEVIRKYAGEEEVANVDFPVQRLSEIHLSSDLAREIIPNGTWNRIYLLLTVAIAVWILSLINFTNLTVAGTLARMQQIQVRKVMGAGSGRIAFKLFSEAVVLTLISATMAVLLFELARPFFADMLPMVPLKLYHLIFLLGISLLTGILAAMYPLVIVFRQSTVNGLKGRQSDATGNRLLSPGNIMVSTQLVMCLMMISCALIMHNQVTFMTTKTPGFEEYQVLAIKDVPEKVKYDYNVFRNSVSAMAGVDGVTAVMEIPSREIRDAGPVTLENSPWEDGNAPVMDIQIVDDDFFKVMDLEFLAGADFSGARIRPDKQPEDIVAYLMNQPREYVINETALKMMGMSDPEEAIGRQMSWRIGDIVLKEGPIVGVVSNYHQETLKNVIDPLVIIREPVWLRNFLVRVNKREMSSVLAGLEASWKDQFTDYPLEVSFLDDLYARHYEAEQRHLTMVTFFTLLAVLIAFLGILALVSYILRTREKELAIRKILGATIASITLLLSRRLLILTCAGIIAAIPLTILAMNEWLGQYAYKITISPVVFMAAIVIIIMVLLAAVMIQIKRLQSENPIRLLSKE